MRALILLLTVLFYFGFSTQAQFKINTDAKPTEYVLKDVSQTSFILDYSLTNFEIVKKTNNHGNFIEIKHPTLKHSVDIGNPNLPYFSKLIEIPYDTEIQVSVLSMEEEIIDLNEADFNEKIMPVQAPVSKSANLNELEFDYNEKLYSTNSFYSEQTAFVEALGVLRGIYFGMIKIAPFAYNPVTNELKLRKKLIVKVEYKNADLKKTNREKKRLYSPAYNSFYKKLINFSKPKSTKDAISTYPLKYVIVSPGEFETSLQEFVNWKTRKGFEVIEAYTNNPDVGNTKESIKAYLQSLYDNATVNNPAPTYILFVGDVAQIPVWTDAYTVEDHVTDLYYCEYDGNESYFPDVYYGRLSAESVSELTAQLDKLLEYEQYLMPDPSYLGNAVLVAGDDDTYAPVHGNGQVHYASNEYWNNSNGIDAYIHLYEHSDLPPWQQEDPSPEIRAQVSNGASYTNYTAHCTENGWSSPSFQVDDVSQLQNAHKYGVMISNCCRSSRFTEDDSFAETITKVAEKGVVAHIGGSNYTYWDEDYYFSVGCQDIVAEPVYSTASNALGMMDRTWHTNGENENDYFTSMGQMMHAGNLAVTEGNTEKVEYYWEIYHLFGDPSLEPYLHQPTALSVSYDNTETPGVSQIDVITEAGAYVAVSLNNTLLGAVLADASGLAEISFDAVNNQATLDVVVSKQNKIPHIGTIEVESNNPYLQADFTANQTQIEIGGLVNFTDLTTNNPTSWSWDFGDGNSSSQQNPTHSYSAAGTYTISLTATNADSSDTSTKTDYITVLSVDAPVADFNANNVEVFVGEEIQFSDLSTNSPNTWSWDFGNGGTSSQQNPSYAYAAPGVYTVSLSAANAYGNNEIEKPDYITVVEDTLGASNDDCADALLLIQQETCNPSSFNSEEATQSLPGITCNSLFAGNADDDVWFKFVAQSEEVNIEVTGAPDFNPVIDFRTGICTGTNIACIDASSNGGTETLTMPSLNIGEMYYVRVYDYNTGGGDFSICVYGEITSNEIIANFSANNTNVSPGETVSFTDNSTLNPTTWFWSFGDGATSTEQNPTHIYNNEGVYTVSLTVGDGNSSDSETKTDYIEVTVPIVVPDNDECDSAIVLTHSPNCNPYSATTEGATESLPAISCNSYTGNADDDVWFKFEALATEAVIEVAGSSSFDAVVDVRSGDCNTGENIACADNTVNNEVETLDISDLAIGETYYIRVYNYDAGSGSGNFTICVTGPIVGDSPEADFTADETTVETGQVVSFMDLSTNTPTSWLWNFGDGSNSTLQNPEHAYVQEGIYTVSLTVTNDFGTDEIEITDFILVDNSVGINNVNNSTIQIHPNPAKDYVWISGLMSGSSVEIIDVTGKSVYTSSVFKEIIKINLNELNTGLYFIKIKKNNNLSIFKLIVD